jgi:2-polyprenyl-3-methyl-5-hydroxy-6-metoxy-1,4-benzoquinol methylase
MILQANPNIELDKFMNLLRLEGIENIDELRYVAINSIKHLKGTRYDRDYSVKTRALELHWYNSLRTGTPDYNVYANDLYLAELWSCWIVYSRKYLTEIQKPNSLPPYGVKHHIGRVNTVVDLGCGIGYTTAALTEMFPNAKVIGTNILDTIQTRIAQRVGNQYAFEILPDAAAINEPVDLVFASEYFEHIYDPISHLREVIKYLQPRRMLIANTFTRDSIGHFNSYLVNGELLDGRATSRAFGAELRANGYKKIQTKLWNNRPAYYAREAL